MTWLTEAIEMLDGYGLVITNQQLVNKRLRVLASKDLIPPEAAPDEDDETSSTEEQHEG